MMATLASCEYEYDMPDVPEMGMSYTVASLPDELKQEMINAVANANTLMDKSDVTFEPIVQEKDANGNILYSGDPRGTVNKSTKTLELGYRCMAYLSDTYKREASLYSRASMATFKFSKQFEVKTSPIKMKIGVSSGDQYTFDTSIAVALYTLKNDLGSVINADLEEIGYYETELTYIIEELNANNKVINTKKINGISGRTFTTRDSTQSLVVKVQVNGRPKNYYTTATELFTYTFPQTKLNKAKVNDITLSASSKYTRSTPDEDEMSSLYTITNNMGSIVKADIEATGYSYSNDVEYTLTEKDKTGKVISTTTKSHISDGTTYMSQKGAASIEIAMKAYGYNPSNYRKALLFTYTFNAVKLSPTKPTDIVLSEALGFTRTTPSASEQCSVYTVTNSFGSKIKSDLEAAHCSTSYYDVSYTMEEKNQSGTIINTVTKSSISYQSFTSEAGATKVSVTISVTGYDKANYNKALVYKYKFADVSLNPLKKTEITLSESMSYTRTKE